MQKADFKMSLLFVAALLAVAAFTNFRMSLTALMARRSTLASIALQRLRISSTRWALIDLLGLNCHYKLQTDDNYGENWS